MAALRRALDIPPGAVVVGDVSRIDAKNDLISWVAVIERLVSRHPNLIALLAGAPVLEVEHRYARRLKREIARRGLDGRVRLLGMRRDLENVLPALDLFLHTSATEGFPNSLMEAMSAGVPVVATRAGGTPELIEEGASGYLAEVGDVEKLAEKVSHLLADAALRHSVGREGLRRVRECFSLRRMVEATEQIYEEVLEEAGRA